MASTWQRRFAGLALAAAVSLPAVSRADRLAVGPGQPLKSPSAAATVARPGDTVVIEPGEYFDCAVWTADHLTITGAGAGVVITDKACEGKALFVARGNDITIPTLIGPQTLRTNAAAQFAYVVEHR